MIRDGGGWIWVGRKRGRRGVYGGRELCRMNEGRVGIESKPRNLVGRRERRGGIIGGMKGLRVVMGIEEGERLELRVEKFGGGGIRRVNGKVFLFNPGELPFVRVEGNKL